MGDPITDSLRPQRIQQRRVKGANIHAEGWALNRLPTLSVVRPTKWGNSFSLKHHTRPEAIRLFCESIADRHTEVWRDLRRSNLACYCTPGEACHADVLLVIANAAEEA
jgi:hypothetical protein